MGNEPTKYDSGTAIVSVKHPSGEIHDIELDASTPPAEFHTALLNSGYMHEPSAEQALENSSSFKQSANEALTQMRGAETQHRIGRGQSGEAGFTVDSQGRPSKVTFSPDPTTRDNHGEMVQTIPSGGIGALHTHDAYHEAAPSPADIEAAKKAKKTIWVVSRSGLSSIDPSGAVSRVYSVDDLTKKH
jgi:hypothetical protein